MLIGLVGVRAMLISGEKRPQLRLRGTPSLAERKGFRLGRN